MQNTPELKYWLNDFKKHAPLIIAGPCSAETEQQVVQIAHSLKNTEVSVFRAGIWKPRTRPGGFEGVGEIGLKWLQKAKEETGLPLAIEVATAHHVKLALEYGIDVLWIGARTTANPFAVQEIADALKDTDKIILIKNPVNPDLSLWIGGIERLYRAGIKKLGVIHRGFSTYEKTKYRNIPEWQIPLELQTRFPDLPLICDPSHITGNRNMIAEVSQQAMNLNFNGLMIETHHHPDEAWSDASQQVTPHTLQQIIQHLSIRKPNDSSEAYNRELDNLRFRIDELDGKLLDIIGKRMHIAEEIGHLKQKYNVALFQTERWQAILERMILEGTQKGVTEDFIIAFYKAIHQESIVHQEKVMNPPK